MIDNNDLIILNGYNILSTNDNGDKLCLLAIINGIII